MLRPVPSIAVLLAIAVSVGDAWGQVAAPPRFGSQQSLGNSALRPNRSEPNKPVAMTNNVIKPVPLSAESQSSALGNIDRHISSQISDLSEKLKTILPDEIAILTTRVAGNEIAAGEALRQWFRFWGFPAALQTCTITSEKRGHFLLMIDDRGLRFDGDWEAVMGFIHGNPALRPWHKAEE